jgi:hypothetical protein
MNPGFWLIRPPRAADGPVAPELWARLALRLAALGAIYLAATLLAGS